MERDIIVVTKKQPITLTPEVVGIYKAVEPIEIKNGLYKTFNEVCVITPYYSAYCGKKTYITIHKDEDVDVIFYHTSNWWSWQKEFYRFSKGLKCDVNYTSKNPFLWLKRKISDWINFRII